MPESKGHCRALGASSRPGLETELNYCRLTNTGTSALAEVPGRNQGPTRLECCASDNVVLADGLRKSCISSSSERDNQALQATAGTLRANKGLVDLDL